MLCINYTLIHYEIPRDRGVLVGVTPHTNERERRGAAVITAVNHRDVIHRTGEGGRRGAALSARGGEGS